MKTGFYAIFLFFISHSFIGYSQDEIVIEGNDTLRISGDFQETVTMIPEHVPRKALMYAAILPGLGQAYNKKYWKMPIVYGGFIGMGFMINYYNDLHSNYKTELLGMLNDPLYVPPSGASETQLRSIVDRTQRERDYMMILTAVFYMIQIADAHIDAHLREFDLNPDFQVRLGPTFNDAQGTGVYGFGIKLKF